MMNNMVQLVKQLSGKLSPSVYTSLQQQSAAARHSQLRQIQRDLKKGDVLGHPLSELPFVVFDLETSGFYPDKGDCILSIGAVKMKGDIVLEEETFYSTVYCENPPEDVLQLTGLTKGELANSKPISEVLGDFYEYIGTSTLVAHHASHEKRFMSHVTWQMLRTTFVHRLLDTSFLTKVVHPSLKLVTLDECCHHYQIPITTRHHALEDALVTAKLWQKNVRFAKELGYETLQDIYTYLARQQQRT
ncbi:exonuclease domain-containing protein [Bacillus sp. JCM 19034]|uniref:exonuclease domain-containing protein n=1 Tax=Bacillus sp. JCM 19034 TaxID=1481928 RepID=UPI0009EA4225|nr:exonuclease domain-containing protein [Bacillus sp. JCM 19034]